MATYLVTGTSSGIGEHIVRELLKQSNARVIGVSRRSTPAAFSSNKVYEHVQGDLASVEVQHKIVTAVGPTLNGAVFNAGILDAVTKIANLKTDLDAFRHVFEVNYFSVVSLTSLLLPALRSAHGRAIYVSSGAALSGYPAWTAYGGSKAALNQFVLELKSEEPEVISVSVAPGIVDTSMQGLIRSTHAEGGEMTKEDGQKFMQLKASGQLVKPEDSGKLYANLAVHASPELSGCYYRYNDPKLKAYA